MPAKRKAEAALSTEDVVASTSWVDYTVAELKEELEQRGLSRGGKKGDLVARLEAHANRPIPLTEPKPTVKKAKKSKKEASPDAETEGPTAAELILYKDQNASGEQRLRPFVSAPDDDYKKKLKKAKKERMFMLGRTKSIDSHGFESEIFDIAGSTGNIYQTTIARSPRCTCMDARTRGNKCKHIYYALIIILKAPAHLCYQNAFLTEEIKHIFANAPVTRATEEKALSDADVSEELPAGTRKPLDGDCPICVFEMDSGEDLVWCKASCGQNFHAECFEQWRRSKNGQRVTCVYCRAEWRDENSPKKPSLKDMAPKIGGYKNIGHLPMYRERH